MDHDKNGETAKSDSNSLVCEVCGQPGVPSWGDSVLCESCYGTLGATCAGRPRKPTETKKPEAEGPVC